MIYRIIKKVVENLHKEVSVLNQIDLNGISTLELERVYLIKNYISFNGVKYRVNSISGNIIEIRNKNADIITSVTNVAPFFFSGRWLEYSNHLAQENTRVMRDKERFPSVFLLSQYEKIKQNYSWQSNITIVLNDINKLYKNKDIYEIETNYLDILQEEFIKELRLISAVVDFTYSVKEITRAELNTNNRTNRYDLSIDLNYNKNNCLT